MKVLHTSDWHIGKQLHKFDLSEDLQLFFDWLFSVIESEKIDLLLVSGDIFDQANPSQAAFKQYYDFLKRLLPLRCKIILTGGNHDSAAVLNAPKELLKSFDISVVGGAVETMEDLFFEVKKEAETVVVAAVPFLKDRDIRKSSAGETYSDKIEQIKIGLRNYFEAVNRHYLENHAGKVFVVMGHLYVQGSQLSESERDIQIGNQAGVAPDIFQKIPHYVALGHIHKPQVISRSGNTYYSGSPVPFSFSEKEDQKQVNIFTIENNEIKNIDFLPVPRFRNLLYFEGSLEEVKEKIRAYNQETQLKSLAEVRVIEPDEKLEIQQEFESYIHSGPHENLEIVKSRLIFSNKIRGATDAFKAGTDVSDVTPIQMFEKKLELEGISENAEELKNAFRELLEELKL